MIPMEILSTLFIEFGAVAFFLFVLIFFLISLNDQHRAEREQWRIDFNNNSDKFLQSHKETTEVIRELTRVIERMK